MGGYGSGRWHGHQKAVVVERCLTLDVLTLAHAGVFARTPAVGALGWTHPVTGAQIAALDYTLVATHPAELCLVLSYTVGPGGHKHAVDESIRLQPTHPYFGGLRWWFTCPLQTGGKNCTRRVRKLYLLPRGCSFGCRHCYHLTYTSCQERHKWDRLCTELVQCAQRVPGFSDITPAMVKQVLGRKG
jgi:hypothetical protein